MKKLQRYRTNNAPAVATDDGCWVADYAVTELEATNAELVKALEDLLDNHCQLVNCGDCGNWDPEEEDEVIAARKALASAKG